MCVRAPPNVAESDLLCYFRASLDFRFGSVPWAILHCLLFLLVYGHWTIILALFPIPKIRHAQSIHIRQMKMVNCIFMTTFPNHFYPSGSLTLFTLIRPDDEWTQTQLLSYILYIIDEWTKTRKFYAVPDRDEQFLIEWEQKPKN